MINNNVTLIIKNEFNKKSSSQRYNDDSML